MAAIFFGLAALAGIGSLVCWIIVLVKLFQNGQVGMGIVSIFCAIVAFVLGWMNATTWNIKNVMLIWTACIVIGIIGQVLGGVLGAAALQP